jgi:hypothetical protein
VSRVVALSVFILGALALGRIWSAHGILWAYALSHAAGTAFVVYAAFSRLSPHAGASPVPQRGRRRETIVQSQTGNSLLR